ncbi:Gfo/Idh/MocA family oxidoreductase [Kribbella qitaiheensis]|uniref:Gfo/Idh/MocA family oxidoreductase n=1 Tax=Kribbella qitaiheensis TaxID=1544730 RepID=A0A7G6WSC9_9ACTN|nr:Gfo/Idh/MocA family oxidoreductase [Kribbella qitaiheensis]QNE16894.1 Gfo/Idh/MocA family oxidoreductase [Kribbella qitaiheensis]
MTNLKVAIVGCGNISRRHAEGYASTGRTTLVGVADIVEAKAQALAEKFGSTPYGDVAELLAAQDPDLVSVATPPGSHAEIAIAVLAAGKSVLLEKPPVLSLAEMDAVAAAERSSEGTVYVVFQHRHGSGAVRAAELLGRGALGIPQVAVCETLWFRPRGYFDPEWRGTWVGEGGGPTLGHGIHQIDLLLHLLGPWRTISATAVRLDRPVEFEDVSMASVIFESGAVATVINSLLSPRELSRIRIDTTGGTLEVDHVYGYSDADWSFSPAPGQDDAAKLGLDPGGRRTGDSAAEAIGADPWTASAGKDVPSNHEAQLNRLVDDLLSGDTHDTTLTNTRPTMEFVTALYASAITGRPIHRADLTAGHPFYQALHGGVPQTKISEAFTI